MEKVRLFFAILGFSLILSSGTCQGLIEFRNFGEIKPFKRGKNCEVTWTGGTSSDILTFQLLKGGIKVVEWTNVSNTGSNQFALPASLKPGKNYRFDVLDGNGLQFRSKNFSIKRKIPLALWFSPLVVAGTVVLISRKYDNELSAPPVKPPGGPN
jgi:hypothetical protein